MAARNPRPARRSPAGAAGGAAGGEWSEKELQRGSRMKLPPYAVDSCSGSSSSGLTDSTSSVGSLPFAWHPAASARPGARDLVHEQWLAGESSDEDADQGWRGSEAAPRPEADGQRADGSLSIAPRSRARPQERELRVAFAALPA
ncbi:unnamed protein product, partial [Prorocentrum cordatum]